VFICGMNCNLAVLNSCRNRSMYRLPFALFCVFGLLPIWFVACAPPPSAPILVAPIASKDTLPPTDTALLRRRVARVVPILPVPKILQGNAKNDLLVGAENMDIYLELLKGKRVGCVVNQTSRIGKRHLVDTLLQRGIKVVEIFAPEHGFRGNADAGDEIANGNDGRTGIPIISLYGKKRRPSAEELANIDILIFDIQDVGTRFYTYLTTLYYVMEECALHHKPLLLLDRPNPNGHYVDGPVLHPAERSFVGALPIPIVHGCTLGEMAQMINGEGWISGGYTCPLTVIVCQNYTHLTAYAPPVKPSPNLPNLKAIYLYPSLCLFEGTCVSVGRGTDHPFQCYGHPDATRGGYSFMPLPNEGNRNPLLNGRTCIGESLADRTDDDLRRQYSQFDLDFISTFYTNFADKAHFFRSDGFFNNLAGDTATRHDIEAGKSGAEIRATWQENLAIYKQKRKKYLLYPDFE
jgi:uncharacterized protein YbbC (DUF1343 family)